MSLRPLVFFPDTKLRTVCSPASTINEATFTLLDDMAETMYAANGIGLAAPQVGVMERIFVVDIGNGLYEFINPEILESSGTDLGPDGCLSIPGISGETYRSLKIRVRAQNRAGEYFELEATDFFARCIQHENDHLNGVLFIDKAVRIYEDKAEEEAEKKVENVPKEIDPSANLCTVQAIKLHYADFLSARVRKYIVEDLNRQANEIQSMLQENPSLLKFTFQKDWTINRRDVEEDMQHLKKLSDVHTQKKLKKLRKK